MYCNRSEDHLRYAEDELLQACFATLRDGTWDLLTASLAVIDKHHPVLFVSFMLRAGTPIGLLFTLRLHPVLGRFFALSQIGFASGHGEQQGQYGQQSFHCFSFSKSVTEAVSSVRGFQPGVRAENQGFMSLLQPNRRDLRRKRNNQMV